LIELTNQHDNKNLQEISYQRDLFDSFCKHKELRFEIAKLYALLKEHQNNLKNLEDKESDRLQKLDFLNFQLQELEKFEPEHEDYLYLKDLKDKKFKEEKYKKIVHLTQESLKNSSDSILSQLYTLVSEHEKLQPDHPILDSLNKAVDACEEAVDQINALHSSMTDDEGLTFEEIDDRLKTYNHLFRKYNTDSEGLSLTFKELVRQREDLEKVEEKKAELQSEISMVMENLNPLLEELTNSRKFSAKAFETEVSKHLKELNMKELRLTVKFKDTEISEFGQESVEFWLSHGRKNLQERPIRQAASGGELSRILLALKSSLENQEAPRTYLFDEIDSGVSGLTAGMVGQKLKRLSTGQQVITITHLPQVAALGDHHFLIEKSSGLEGQETNLNTLKKQERIQELARLLSGKSITNTSLKHAEELLSEAP
jgi:DNA repair protein RecN (Recombination protein N)